MNKYYVYILSLILLNSLLNCKINQETKDDDYYVFKVKYLLSNQDQLASSSYFLIKTKIDNIDRFVNQDKYFNLENVNGKIIETFNCYPILDYPVKFWKQSCSEKKLVFPQNLKKIAKIDSLKLENIFSNLVNDSSYNFKSLKTKKSAKYKFKLGYCKVKNPDFCLIKWTHIITDSTAVLMEGFKFNDPQLPHE